MMRRAIPALVAIVLSGCSWFGGGAPVQEPTPLKELAERAVRVDVAWDEDTGEGNEQPYAGLQLAVADSVVYTAGVKGLVSAFRLEDGEELWRAETETLITGGPAVVGDLVVFGTLSGEVVAPVPMIASRRGIWVISRIVL